MSAFLVLTPSHRCDSQLAIAAARAGEVGVVDLGYADDRCTQNAALQALATHAGARGENWGVRWDAWGDVERDSALLSGLAEQPWPLLILAGLPVGFNPDPLRKVLKSARTLSEKTYLEVCTLSQALAAQEAGFGGVIVKGHEAAASVGPESTFILLQRLHSQLSIPWFVQGGIAPDTAAAAFLAGAAGVVLCEQIWLAAESPLSRAERRLWAGLDGSETAVIGEAENEYRFFSRANRELFDDFERAIADGDDWHALLRRRMVSDARRMRSNNDLNEVLVPLSPDIAFARRLAEENVTVAGILDAFKHRIEENLQVAAARSALAPNGPLAQSLRTEFPILQGPMTRVSDVAPFCRQVAENGGLPFLALALMRGDEVRALLNETRSQVGNKSWGVGILGFVPAELRKEQLAVVRDVRPPFALIAGGRPSQARQLEEDGIATFLHVPSPGLLESFIQDGCRKFIFEGRECGGHVGPRSSFVLWQSAIDVLTSVKVNNPEDFQIVFAGGIHDWLSAAMVAALAAPLTARGMKIGVLMGTAYLFTHEAVECGAILPGFQDQAVACTETVLLKTGIGHETRCSATPFAEEFNATRKLLIRDGKSPDDVRNELEHLNLGRLRIAAKGLARQAVASGTNRKGDLFSTGADDQLKSGMYMIGQVATLRCETVPMRDLHRDVSRMSSERLRKLSKRRLPWQEARKRSAQRTRRAKSARKTADIAIIGLAGHFPRATSVRTFWENIVQCRHAFEEVPPKRWRAEDFFAPGGVQPDRVYSKWGAFLADSVFDPMKWLIPPASLPSIDPTQLVALEVSWQALVDAGYDRRKFARERMGVVFASAGATEMEIQYAFRTMMRHYFPMVRGISQETSREFMRQLEDVLPAWTEDSFAGFLHNVIAGRITNRLNLGGPNFVVDAACASSLTAIHTAVEHLRSGASDSMLVGAADMTNHPSCFMSFAQTQALSPTGRPRPFDQSADGITLGECIAAVVLKRLPDAERDGDKIYAVIKGIGASSDGKARSMTSPDPPGQIAALRRAYDDAGISPTGVSLIEAHATGTAVGDAAEAVSLKKFFAGSERRSRAAVGSVKSMIGHAKTAAGLASLVKTALALDQQVVPPTLGVENPLAELAAADSPLYVNSETRPWFPPQGDEPRRAGINSFGFGGTNFHVVVEEYTGNFHHQLDVDLAPRTAEIVCWSRNRREEIIEALERLQSQLSAAPVIDLAQLCYSICLDSAGAGRVANKCRLSLAATSVDDLKTKLRQSRERLLKNETNIVDESGIYYSEEAPLAPGEICFLYPGQGSQSVNMLRDLLVGNRWAHDIFTRLDDAFQTAYGKPLNQFVYPPPAFTKEARKAQQGELNETRIAQPALGAVEVFATRLLERFGVVPGQTAGHSYGEYVALWAAGCLSLDDVLRLSMQRGQIVADAARDVPGCMAAVAANADDVVKALTQWNSQAAPANFNSPEQTIIAGTDAEIDRAIAGFAKLGLATRKIPVTAAFHTSAMISAAKQLTEHLNAVPFHKPVIPVSGNTTGRLYPESAEEIRSLLARHLVEPVQFERQIRQLHADGVRLFLEVGPGTVLSKLVRTILKRATDCTALAIDAPDTDAWTHLANVLARTAAMGLPVKMESWFDTRGLQDLTVGQYLDEVARTKTPKPTDWILTASRAIPAGSPPVNRRPVENGMSARSSDNVPAQQSIETPSPAGSGPPCHTSPAPGIEPSPRQSSAGEAGVRSPLSVSAALKRQKQEQSSLPENSHSLPRTDSSQSDSTPETDMTMPNDPLVVREEPALRGEPQSSWLPMLQNTMSQWLELQTAQNRLLERFLEIQERLVFGAATTTHAEPPRALAAPVVRPIKPAVAARPPAPPVASAPVHIPREPSPPSGPRVVVPAAAPVKSTPAPVLSTAAPAAARPAPPAAPGLESSTSQGNGDVPSTEEFRRDLLLAVSQRTGYPVDVLDENTALEAGLGIDSIKTVEIFSNLKKYHFYFRAVDEDDEEMLLMFSQLKTLRAIVESYDERCKRFAAVNRGANGAAPAHGGNGVASQTGEQKPVDGAVQRYAVAAVEAPADSNGKKKSSPMTT